MNLIPARLKDEALLGEIEKYKGDDERFHLWWLGQSGYLLLWKGMQVLLDPYLSDSLTEKYKDTNKPHVRMSERVIDPALLKDIYIVSSSHNHTDHLDAHTLIPVFKNNPDATFIIPEANREFVAERTQRAVHIPVGLNAGSTFTKGEFTFHGIPAAHNQIEKDDKGRHKYMGYVISFGNWSIYHSGDTLWFEGMVDLLKRFNVDVALLPINGNDPARGVAGNLNTAEAAQLASQIEAKVVIPCHYDMFTFNTANPADFVAEAERLKQRYCVLPAGGRFDC